MPKYDPNKPAIPRRAPTYSPREIKALANAQAIIARAFVHGSWRETRFEPEPGQSVRALVEQIQASIAKNPAFMRTVLYAEGRDKGQPLLANIPNDYIPEELE